MTESQNKQTVHSRFRETLASQTPIIVGGGSGTLQQMREAIEAGASVLSVGSAFVFYGPCRVVLISYPEKTELWSLRQ